MESVIKKLGKTSITVEKDYHSSEKEYNKLTVVEEQGAFKTYLSRKPVPIGIELTNREYWIPFSGVLESIVFDYLKFKKDYASGKSIEDNAIITRHILDRNIKRIKIALKTISEEELDDNAVIERTIKDRNITSNKIAQKNVLTEHFAKKSVITSILADYAITAIKLADNSVTTRSIVNENVTQEKLANNSVNESKIVDKTITNSKIADDTIELEKLSTTLQNIINSVTNVPEDLIRLNEIDNELKKLIIAESVRATNAENINTQLITNEVARLDETDNEIKEKLNDKTNEINVAKEEALQAIAENEQSAITNFNSQRVTPEMLSESTKQLIEASGGGTITNLADDEDLTSVNVGGTDVIRFKDKDYNKLLQTGFGRVYLRKNIVNGINTLVQSMMDKSNTIYIIQYDYDLNGATITVPTNCILKFEGGSFNNGVLTVAYSNVTIQGPTSFENVKILVNNTNCHILSIDIVNESKQGIYSNSTNGCSGLAIKNCKVVSKGNDCIKVVADNAVEHIQNITIEGCDLQFYRIGIEFQSHVENSSYIENCVISNNKIKLYDPDSYQYGFGISLSGFGNNVLVEKNEISSCRIGIENPEFSGTRIINNVITGITTRTRLLAFSNKNSDKAYISGNVFNTGQIYISRGINTFFTNNNCYVNEVRFETSSDCKIMGNNITSYGYTGIFFDNTGGSYIDNNYIYTSSDKGEAAIHFYGENSTNNRVLNCHFLKSNPAYGAMIQNTNGATGNIIYSYINENSKSTYYPEFTTKFTTIDNKITAIDTVYTISSDYKPLDAQRIKNFYFYKNSSVEEAVFSIRVPKTQFSVYFMFHVFADCGDNNVNSGVYEFIIDRVAYSASDVGINLKRIRNIPNIRYEYSSDDNYLYFNVILVGTSGNRGLNLYVLEGTSNTDNICINLKERTAVYTKETDGSGTSEQRPSNIPNNYQYFDTTLEKPIWWTGTKWVDATGADL